LLIQEQQQEDPFFPNLILSTREAKKPKMAQSCLNLVQLNTPGVLSFIFESLPF